MGLPLVTEGEGLMVWLQKAFTSVAVEDICRLIMALWAIWKGRNEIVWKEGFFCLASVKRVAATTLESWRKAQEASSRLRCNTSPQGVHRWQKPEMDWIKINVDAASNVRSGKWAWACVGRDSNGNFLGAISRVVKAIWSPVEAEAIGVKEAIIWAIKMGWQKVVIESDAELVVAGVQGE
ncbi:unnamed protein product, partial [Cuscuta epithymum]